MEAHSGKLYCKYDLMGALCGLISAFKMGLGRKALDKGM